jgi:hypothetical protein
VTDDRRCAFNSPLVNARIFVNACLAGQWRSPICARAPQGLRCNVIHMRSNGGRIKRGGSFSPLAFAGALQGPGPTC